MHVNQRLAWVFTWAVFAAFAVPDAVNMFKVLAQFAGAAAVLAGFVIGVGLLTGLDR